jgi:hypothetical protein
MQPPVHPRAVVDGISHVLEIFKKHYRSRELRNPIDYLPRHLVQTIVNVVAFLCLYDRFKPSLPSGLHPLSLGEKLVSPLFD